MDKQKWMYSGDYLAEGLSPSYLVMTRTGVDYRTKVIDYNMITWEYTMIMITFILSVINNDYIVK